MNGSSRDLRATSIFFGTPDFAVPSLEAALATTQVLAVVTQPDRPKGRGLEVQPCPVKIRALEAGLPVYSPASLKKPSDELSRLEAFLSAQPRPDLVLVTAYGNLLPQKYLDLASRGPINVHASLLPRWRGAAPIQRAIEAGDEISGVCLQRMVMELDAGPILAEASYPIDPNLRSSTAFRDLSVLGGDLLKRYLSTNPLELRGQDQDPAKITLAAKIRKEESGLASTWNLRDLHGRICAFDPWPGVRARLEDGTELRLVESARSREPLAASTGDFRLHRRDGHVFVRQGTAEIELRRVQFASKPVQEASVALRNFFDRLGRAEATLLPL